MIATVNCTIITQKFESYPPYAESPISANSKFSLYQCLGRKEDANNIESTHPVPSFFIYHNNHTIYIYIYWSVCGCYYGRWTAEGEWEGGRDFCNEIILLPCVLLRKRNEKLNEERKVNIERHRWVGDDGRSILHDPRWRRKP